MRLPRWLRHYVARLEAAESIESGGVLFDYANGAWKVLHAWKGECQGCKEAVAIVENFLNSGRDEVYVAIVNTGERHEHKGVIQVVYPGRKVWERYFSDRVYNFVDAYTDAVNKCREIAKELGYQDPGRNHTSSDILEAE
jgi:hypothetical protein